MHVHLVLRMYAYLFSRRKCIQYRSVNKKIKKKNINKNIEYVDFISTQQTHIIHMLAYTMNPKNYGVDKFGLFTIKYFMECSVKQRLL